MTWFYRVSHYILTPDAPRRPSRSANQEVLEAQYDETEDMIVIFWCIVEMDRADIETQLFEDDTPQLTLMDNMIVELLNVVQYRRR